MGSYNYEDVRTRGSSRPSGRSFFEEEEPAKSTPKPPSSSKPSGTKRASAATPPVSLSADKISKPKGSMNLIIGFDTTNSMEKWRENVRQKSGYLLEETLKYAPDLEVAVAGVGDHCDGKKLLQPRDFTKDQDQLQANLDSIEDTDGGDIPEGYEDFFHLIASAPLEGTDTHVILVCDSIPHGMGVLGDDGCPLGLDFRKELEGMRKAVAGFYVISCKASTLTRQRQMSMVKEKAELIPLDDFLRLTNTFQGIVAILKGKYDEFLKTMKTTRSDARADQMGKTLRTFAGSKGKTGK